MTEEKQIEEMAKHCCFPCEMEYNGGCIEDRKPCECYIALETAKRLYATGYRKQSEGEWIWINQATGYLEPPYGDTCKCSLCEFVIDVSESNYKYCPHCGAKMKGCEQ